MSTAMIVNHHVASIKHAIKLKRVSYTCVFKTEPAHDMRTCRLIEPPYRYDTSYIILPWRVVGQLI